MTALWWLLPLIIMFGSISWALWWPVGTASWAGWLSLIPRLIGALIVSMLCWMISAVCQ